MREREEDLRPQAIKKDIDIFRHDADEDGKKERIDEESAFIGPLPIVQIIPPTLR